MCVLLMLVSGTSSDNTSKTNAYYYLMATLTLEALLDEGSRYILSVPRSSQTQLSIPIYPCHKNMQGFCYVYIVKLCLEALQTQDFRLNIY